MNTFSFAWPALLLALPLPLLLRLACAPAEAGTALRVPSLPPSAASPGSSRMALPLWIAALAWLLLVLAAARPQVPLNAQPDSVSGRDLMLAFDVSMSMATADLRVNDKAVDRLQAARLLAGEFIGRRRGDRIGLLVFGAQAYLHTPLTFDVQAVRTALAATEAGLAGRETALGDAIALATKHLRALPDSQRVLVLLTDGANTAGTLAPDRATWLAQRENVRIHVVGIGAATADDDATLRRISTQTGGMYQRATDSKAIARILDEIDRLEPLAAVEKAPAMRELYVWPLTLALLLAVGLALHRTRGVAA